MYRRDRLCYIEYDVCKDAVYILGFMYDEKTKSFVYGFVAELRNNELINKTKLSEKKFDFLCRYKNLEIMGVTDKSKERFGSKYENYDLSKIQNKKIYLSDHIKKNKN